MSSPPSPPRPILDKMLNLILESLRTRPKSQHHPGNAGSTQCTTPERRSRRDPASNIVLAPRKQPISTIFDPAGRQGAKKDPSEFSGLLTSGPAAYALGKVDKIVEPRTIGHHIALSGQCQY